MMCPTPNIRVFNNTHLALPIAMSFLYNFSKKNVCGYSWESHCTTGFHDDFFCCTFTGKEKDEETGYGYFGARYMDHELMTMWLSVDPMADKYPNISPYAYCAWNPVKLVDPDGREIWILTDRYNPNAQRIKWMEKGLFYEDGTAYDGNNEFVQQTAQALDAIYDDNNSRFLLYKFSGESEYDLEISQYKETYYEERTGNGVLQKIQGMSFNPTQGLAQCKPDAEEEEYSAPFISLLHEFGHAYDAATDYQEYCNRRNTPTGDAYGDREEMFVIQQYEWPAAAKHGMLQRTSHKYGVEGLTIIRTNGPLSSQPIKQ